MNWLLEILLNQVLCTTLADTYDAQDQLVLLLNLLGAEAIPELVAVLVVSEPLFGAGLTITLSMERVGLLPPSCRCF